jgi:ubiquinone/menaquinone biosynthesis C-methylase UbiE
VTAAARATNEEGSMNRRSSAADWTAVDRTGDPNAFVGYLDAVTGQEAVQAYKNESYARMDLKPGDRALDVGCGAGDDARALARLVAPRGSVVGVDLSEKMVEEARRRSDGLGLPIEFRTGEAHRLDFGDATIDAARADRVFQHLADPERALAELIRVTRPGGRIVVCDPDWGSLLVDGPDRTTTRAVLAEIAAGIPNAWMGRELYGLFRRAGLTEVAVVAGVATVTDYAKADRLLHIGEGLTKARNAGTVTAEAADAWARGLEEAAAAGRFFSALTAFVVAGRRP